MGIQSCCACCSRPISVTRARTLKMVPYTKIILSLLVILNICQALPVSQKEGEKAEEVASTEIDIPIDEAKEFKYELNRDHELQGSINGGQSGWALEQIAHGAKPQEVITGSRPKRQNDPMAVSMTDALEAPADEKTKEVDEPAPIVNEAYAKRLEGSAIYKALALSGGGRTTVERGPGGYGRKKRQSISFEEESVQDDVNEIQQTVRLIVEEPKIKAWGETGLVQHQERKRRMSDDQDGIEEIPEPRQGPVDSAYAQMIAQSSNPEEVLLLAETIKRPKRQSENVAEVETEVEPATEVDEPAPIVNEAYAKRLAGSAIYKALALSGGGRSTVDRGPGGYGRKKRQSISFDDEVIMQLIFPVQDDVNEIQQTASLIVKPKIKAWGETGLVQNQN